MIKFLLLATFVAAAVAGPTYRIVEPGITGPAPVVPDNKPIAIGPAIVNPGGVSIGPAIIDNYEPISIGPAIVDESVAVPAPALTPEAGKLPLVQIIINLNNQGQIVGAPVVISPAPVESGIVPEPVIVVDQPAEPVTVVEAAPVVIGNPIFPSPVITLPEELN